MNREAKQELRRVLMGRTLIAEDGRLVAMEKGQLRMPMGVSDGAGAAAFLGICKRRRRLKVKCSEKEARQMAFGIMSRIGRGLYLPNQPEAAACLIRYVLTRPAVLTFDYQDGIPLLTAWAGRGLTAWFSLSRALKAFEKQMPKQFSLSQEALPEDTEKAERKKRKQEKKEARRQKRLAKQKAGRAEAQNAKEESANESESESH